MDLDFLGREGEEGFPWRYRTDFHLLLDLGVIVFLPGYGQGFGIRRRSSGGRHIEHVYPIDLKSSGQLQRRS